MNKLGVICILLTITVSGLFVLFMYQEFSYSDLISNHSRLLADYASLAGDHSDLSANYSTLAGDYSRLSANYSTLESDYSNLYDGFTSLEVDYVALQSKEVSTAQALENYESWRAYVHSYLYLNASFQRTLNNNEIHSLESLVRSTLSDADAWWGSTRELYDYVITTIEYASDECFPRPPSTYEFEHNLYANETVTQSYMSPTETLAVEQGDCDDQAVLLYGLLRAYDKHVYEVDYQLWIAWVELGEATHLAMALPVQGGKLTILDPAGHYYTGMTGSLTANTPLDELTTYSQHWNHLGGIIRITLYDIQNGIGTIVTSGNIQEVANYLAG
ncbi:MAG: hypothetical protein ACXADB_14655 [Candidatus Hermodarchaeia archaeon]|jgi:hypothetical protein